MLTGRVWGALVPAPVVTAGEAVRSHGCAAVENCNCAPVWPLLPLAAPGDGLGQVRLGNPERYSLKESELWCGVLSNPAVPLQLGFLGIVSFLTMSGGGG